MTIEEMKQIISQKGYTYKQIAENTGISLVAINKVFSEGAKSADYNTLLTMKHFFSEETLLREESAYRVEKTQGEYILDDYYALPDERRVELIDGVIYDMASPTTIHQILCVKMLFKIESYIQKRKGTCIVLTSPVDVQLDCDDKTMLQPDVVVICDRDKLIRRCIYGAPDFVVEILSPSTKKKDSTIKRHKYLAAGVKEYWMVDPDKKRVVVYHLDDDDSPVIHGFDRKIPVAVFDGELEIDMGEIADAITFVKD